MEIIYSTKFLREYKKLSIPIKRLAEKREQIFRINQYDPRLKTHALQNKLKGFSAFSINYQIRVIFEFVDANTVWFHSVGSHDIYK